MAWDSNGGKKSGRNPRECAEAKIQRVRIADIRGVATRANALRQSLNISLLRNILEVATRANALRQRENGNSASRFTFVATRANALRQRPVDLL